MSKFSIFQIDHKSNPDAACDAFLYNETGRLFNAGRAIDLLRSGAYTHVATVEAQALEHVYELMNIWPGNESEWLVRHAPIHSLSVGDVVILHDTNAAFIVASLGYDFLTTVPASMMEGEPFDTDGPQERRDYSVDSPEMDATE